MCIDPFNLGSDLWRRTTQFTEVKNRRCPPMGITNAIKVTRSMALIPIVTTPLEIATDFTGVEFGVGRTSRGRSKTNRIVTRNNNLGQGSGFCYCITKWVLYNALYSWRKHTLTTGLKPSPNCLTTNAIIHQLGLTEFTLPLASSDSPFLLLSDFRQVLVFRQSLQT
jgi:hypothetical protein